MPPLPFFVLACPATVTLLLRALAGELPRDDYFDAWEALADPDAYQPSDEVRVWMQEHWRELMRPTQTDASPAGQSSELSDGSIPTVPTLSAIARAPILREDWMQPVLSEYVKNGGVVIQAAKAGPIHRDTVYAYIKHDPEFARAFADAEEERKGLIRSTIKARSIDGWEEPVFGRMDRVVEGKVISETVVVGYIRKHDNRVLLRWAEACLEEFTKQGEGTSINISNSASASASANANVELAASPELLDKLQKRNRKQMEKKLARVTRQKPGTN